MQIERFEKNPFTENMIVPVSQKLVKMSPLNDEDSLMLVHKATGQCAGTHMMSHRKVDGTKFVKLFSQNIGRMLELSKPGIKAFGVLIWAVQETAIKKDQVLLGRCTLRNFLAVTTELQPNVTISEATFSRGLRELQKAKIIAKSMRHGSYFINPNFIFNGDRIAFTNVIERVADDVAVVAEKNHVLPLL